MAHCIQSFAGKPYVVRLGDQNLARTDDGANPKEYKIKHITKHERYDQFTKENDIALIELTKDVEFDEKYIRPACLQQTKKFNKTVVAVRNFFQRLRLRFVIFKAFRLDGARLTLLVKHLTS